MPRFVENDQSVLFGSSSPKPTLARVLAHCVVRANSQTGIAKFDAQAVDELFGKRPKARDVRALANSLAAEALRYIDGDLMLITTIGAVTLNTAENTFEVTLAPCLFARLEKMRQFAEANDLTNLIAVRGNYAKALYKLLSAQTKWPAVFTLEQLRKELGVPTASYHHIGDFNRIVLKTALRSIAKLTDLRIGVRPVKESRKFTGYAFELLDIAPPHPTGEPPESSKTTQQLYDAIPAMNPKGPKGRHKQRRRKEAKPAEPAKA